MIMTPYWLSISITGISSMKEELQDKLYKKYPSLFANKDKSIQESCMAWGKAFL